MDIRKLELFCKVVELQSFTLAGKACFLSQPTVSEHIKELEQMLGQKLLNRFKQKIRPTPAGELLYQYADKILLTRQEAVKALEQFGNRLAGRIVIGCGTIPGTYILPELLSRFREKYPDIRATLQISSSKTIADRITEEKLDLGVVGARWNEPGLTWKKLYTDSLVLIVPPDHPFSQKKHVTCSEILHQPFIMREPGSGTRKVIADFFKKKGFRESDLKEVIQIGSSAAVKEAVKAGCGISILSRRAVLDAVGCSRLKVVPVRDLKLERPFYLVQRKNSELLPIVKLFRDYLIQKASEEKPE